MSVTTTLASCAIFTSKLDCALVMWPDCLCHAMPRNDDPQLWKKKLMAKGNLTWGCAESLANFTPSLCEKIRFVSIRGNRRLLFRSLTGTADRRKLKIWQVRDGFPMLNGATWRPASPLAAIREQVGPLLFWTGSLRDYLPSGRASAANQGRFTMQTAAGEFQHASPARGLGAGLSSFTDASGVFHEREKTEHMPLSHG